jgi:2-hydroxycyclohexanecarboxyl-CoA dehydrogenase
MTTFADKTAMVTGAASGIGRATTLALLERGAQVIAADRDTDGLQRLAETSASTALTWHALDLADEASIDAFATSTLADSQPDILVNAAGWDRSEPFIKNSREFIRDVVAINYLGPVLLTQAILQRAVELERHLRVVNLASDAGRVGSAGETVYSGTKGAVIAFTKSVARETARYGFNINCVCPGPTDTPLFAAMDDKLRQALIRAVPFKRLALPEEIAESILFFASEQANFVTGQVLSVSGGLTMAD